MIDATGREWIEGSERNPCDCAWCGEVVPRVTLGPDGENVCETCLGANATYIAEVMTFNAEVSSTRAHGLALARVASLLLAHPGATEIEVTAEHDGRILAVARWCA